MGNQLDSDNPEGRRVEERRHRDRAYRELVQLGIKLSRERDRSRLAAEVLAAAKQICQADGAALYLRTLEDQLVLAQWSYAAKGVDEGGLDDRPLNQQKGQIEPLIMFSGAETISPIVRSAEENVTVFLEDVYGATDYDCGRQIALDSDHGYKTDNLLAIPLCDSADQVIAVLVVLNRSLEESFAEEAVVLTEMLAAQSGGFFENLELYEWVVAMGIVLTSERDPHALAERIVIEAKRLANAQGGALLLRSSDDNLVYTILQNDITGESLGGTTGREIDLKPVPLYLGAGGEANKQDVAAKAAHTQESVAVADAAGSSSYTFDPEVWREADGGGPTTSVFAMPLIGRNGSTLGVVLLRNAKNRQTGEIKEFDQHTRNLVQALASQAAVAVDNQEVYQQLIKTGISLSAERDHNLLMEKILLEAKGICNAEGGTLYLMQDDARQLKFTTVHNDVLGIAMGGTTGQEITFPPLNLYDPDSGEANHRNVATHVALTGEAVNIEDAYMAADFDFSGTRRFDQTTGYRSKSFLTVPLKDRDENVIGVLQLINARDWETGEVVPFSHITQPLVESLASQAAVALNNQQLLEAQKNLLDAFIKLIAGAIDAKSPYTGGHCQRVPALAQMLADKACETKDAPFAEFDLDDDGQYELYIASWLHDCGKVTTPEYVVDKATKLETIYNRIHEIRMRFEVAKREVDIAYYKILAEGADDSAALKKARDEELAKLDDDYAFIAECNVGGEFIDDERLERIKEIAERTWIRTLDDRLGLSQAEELNFEGIEKPKLPVVENMLSDRPEHVIRWDEGEKFPDDNPWGIKMTTPENKYNLGEVYNLSIGRGTLTEEERYKINHHIVQTIVMLEELPWPRHLKRVPEFAGGHHEKMDGTGYPRQIPGATMSVPARIMALADIFEALTASDRPYKPSKTLSQAVKIMGFMVKDKHIDGELFKLFLKSGLHVEYANKYLKPDQIDDVDVSQYLDG